MEFAELNMQTFMTGIVPAIMIFFLVFFNIRKMQKQAKIMKEMHSCEGKCAGCQHGASCTSDKKQNEAK